MTMTPTMRGSRKGFTLIEILVSSCIFLVVLLAIYQVLDTSHSTYISGMKKQDIQQQARIAMDEMAKRIRMAGFFSENFDSTVSATNPISGNNRLAIRVATPQTLAVYGDLDATRPNPTPYDTTKPWSNVFLFCLYPNPSPNPDGTRSGVILGRKGPDVAASYGCNCPNSPDPTDCTKSGDVLIENIPLPNYPTLPTVFSYYGTNASGDFVQVTGTAGKLDNVGLASPAAIPALTPSIDRQLVQTVIVTLTVVEKVTHQADQLYTLSSTIQRRNPNPK
jgi:prepilin-type N-terminal cleavage/methylation domain-containing protein